MVASVFCTALLALVDSPARSEHVAEAVQVVPVDASADVATPCTAVEEGTTLPAACASVEEALTVAGDGDVVLLAAGVYTGSTSRQLEMQGQVR